MATVIGTAANHTALFATLLDTLQDNDWTVEWGASPSLVLRSPDGALLGLKLVSRPTPDEFEIQLSGMDGVLQNATAFDAHINSSPTHVRCFLDSGSMKYWISVNDRRFVMVVRMSTVFQALYGGFFLPYAPPTAYGYPLFIGGTVGQQTQYNASGWRSTEDGHRHFPHAYYESYSLNLHPSSALMLDPMGQWLNCAATGAQGNVAIGPRRFHSGFGAEAGYGAGNYGYADIRQRMRADFDGQFALTPLTLMQSSPGDQTYGILDGCYHVAGAGNAAENIVTVDSVDHLVVQDAFRTAIGEYWAMGLN